jgi:radical SAM superfamily enzyme YgiQ (UPF0313 family)
MRELVELGVSWLWLGLESEDSQYKKLNGVDTKKLIRELRSHGIKTLGSTIIGLEHHTPDNIASEIGHAIDHDTDFHQFMLYTPLPGTPLHEQIEREGRLVETDPADIHGQYQFNFRHAAISREDSKRFLDMAFRRDFEQNGPSLYRICRTTYEGWRRYRNDADLRVRRRFAWESRRLQDVYCAMLWAMERRLRKKNPAVSRRIAVLRRELHREFGIKTGLLTRLLGPVLAWTSAREKRRLADGLKWEPPMILERKNWNTVSQESEATSAPLTCLVSPTARLPAASPG